MSRNVDAVRSGFDLWNDRGWKDAASRYTETATLVDHGREVTYEGRDEIAASWVEIVKGFPDAELTDLTSYDAGDTVVTTVVGRGTNKGEVMGMPATGRRVSLPFVSIAHFDENGLIDREEQYSDAFSMLVQLGHAKAPAQA